MGIKLIYFFAFFFFVISCNSTNKKISKSYSYTESDYINAYKTIVLYGCLNEGTKGNFSNFLKQNNDLGLFSEVDLIFHSTANIADSLGRLYAKTIKQFEYGDGKGKVPNYSRCVHYALSREIDSISKKSYKDLFKE